MRVTHQPILGVLGRKTRMGTCVATFRCGQGPRERHSVTSRVW